MTRRVSGRVPSDRGEKREYKGDIRLTWEELKRGRARARELGVTFAHLMRMLLREDVGLPVFGTSGKRQTDARQTPDERLTNDAAGALAGTDEKR